MFLWFNKKPWRRRQADKPHLHPVNQFLAILEYERTRADRSGSTLSLLVLSPRHHERETAVLADLLQWRLRSTDEAGYLDKHRIGVSLPYTPARGAWKVAEDICESIADRGTPPDCEVYVYPSDHWPTSREASGETSETSETSETFPLSGALESFLLKSVPVWKRTCDIVGALVGLVLLSPLLLASAALIKLTSAGPVLFSQRRDGLGGKPFTIYKLRTMRVGADRQKDLLRSQSEQDGPAFRLKNDPRVTPIGRFLRKTCIDELPQLWNVLIGDMSLVGPRPLPSNEMGQCTGWERRRLDVTPGLTCIWQVYGWSRVTFAEWMRMDIQYLNKRTLQHDGKLILATVAALLRRPGGHY